MQETSRLDRALGWLVGAANAVSAAFVLLLMILVVADITGRYLFNSPVPMAYEFGSFMLVFIVFLALASTQRAGAHIRVEFVTLRLPPRARTCLDILAYCLGILVYATILWRGFGWGLDLVAGGRLRGRADQHSPLPVAVRRAPRRRHSVPAICRRRRAAAPRPQETAIGSPTWIR